MTALIFATTVSGLFFPLNPGDTQCFGFSIASDAPLKHLGSYETSGSEEGVYVTIRKEYDGVEVFNGVRPSGKIEATHDITGSYTLCFRSIVRTAVQTVSFNLHIDSTAKSIVTTSHTDKVQLLVAELETRAATIIDQQQYAITRESVHRDTAESTNSRLMWWTMLEVLCLILLAGFQVYYLKSFFEVKVHV